MKQIIEQWLTDKTVVRLTAIKPQTFSLIFLPTDRLNSNEAQTKEFISQLASELAAHIENSKTAH